MPSAKTVLRFTLAGLVAASVATLSGPALGMPGASQALSGLRVQTLRQQSHHNCHQLQRLPPGAVRRSPASSIEKHVGAANVAARVEPDPAGFRDAMQRYAYSEGALFRIYAKPDQVTDIALQPGEALVGPGPVAAGDTARWIIGDTTSGSGATRRVHILVKPTRVNLATNMVINTDRRTYHIELRANPTVYMAAVSWTYPQDALIAIRRAKPADSKAVPVAEGVMLDRLNFDYRISGDKPAWRPLRVFDDGRQTMVDFGRDIARGDLPPLFAIGPSGKAELVNYRVRGRFIVIDRIVSKAELLLGAGHHQTRVVITNRAGLRK